MANLILVAGAVIVLAVLLVALPVLTWLTRTPPRPRTDSTSTQEARNQ